MGDYRKLLAWEVAHELAVACYRRTEHWPARERYGLTSQLRRAAMSSASNLAEGAARAGRREFSHHVNIALGSLSEVEYLIRLACDVGIAQDAEVEELGALVHHAGQLTFKLYRSLQSQDREPSGRAAERPSNVKRSAPSPGSSPDSP